MKEKYYKIKKDIAKRAGFDERMREEVDGEYLMLSDKDITMISFTVAEKIDILQADEVTEADIEKARKRKQSKRKKKVDNSKKEEENGN